MPRAALAFVALLLASCSSDPPVSPDAAIGDRCSPGIAGACTCDNGWGGTRSCGPGGSTGPCICQPPQDSGTPDAAVGDVVTDVPPLDVAAPDVAPDVAPDAPAEGG